MKIRQVKFFKSVDTEMADMERQINRWIRKTGVDVISITGNLAAQPSSGGPMSTFSASDILAVVTYEVEYAGQTGQARKPAAETSGADPAGPVSSTPTE